MSTKQPIRLLDLFRYYKGLPHQMAALSELEAAMPASLLTRDNAWFKTWSQSGKQPDPAWVAPATKLIKDWEGLRLEAYKCPAGIPTIGYGATRFPGKGPVRTGDTITASEAEALLRDDLLDRVAPNVFELIPAAQKYGANQQAALISWAFNVGLGAVEDSTLRKRLAAGESARVVIPKELPRWDKANGAPLPGLVRRRAAEVALFMGSGVAPSQQTVRLQVPYEAQNDNASGSGYRECFSSSAAMLARFYGKVKNDDEYNRIRAKYGDTTDSNAQIKALNSLGIKAQFRTTGTVALLESELKAGRPVMAGWLHQGPVNKPSGGGHWSVVTGYTSEAFIHNDPNGEADLVNGGYANHSKGAGITYSRKNWLPRWLPEGANSGWCITVAT